MARWVSLFLALVAINLPMLSRAQNPQAAKWEVDIGDCPVGGAFKVRGFPSCVAAKQFVEGVYPSRCNKPGTVLCFSGSMCSTNEGAQEFRFAPPGESCAGNRIGVANPSACDDPNANRIDHPVLGLICEPKLYSSPPNLGPPGPGCPNGKCVGDPVNPSIGNLFQTEVDYTGFGLFPLRFVRHYNSLTASKVQVGIGAGWTHTYSRRLGYNPANASVVSALREDGKLLAFKLENGVYVGDTHFSEKLVRNAGTNDWILTNSNDEAERYDASGRLVSVTNRAGLYQTLAYDAAGRLLTVTDRFGRVLSFAYGDLNRISTVILPGVGTLAYEYNSQNANLEKVTYADTTYREYQYHADPFLPNHLIGITDERRIPFATFDYDIFTGQSGAAEKIGLVNLAEHALGAERHRFTNDTTTTGNRSVTIKQYRTEQDFATRTYTYSSFGGIAANIAIAGEACPSCGPKGAGFNSANAIITSTTDWNDKKTCLAYHADGRHLEKRRIEGSSSDCSTLVLDAVPALSAPQRMISTEWENNFRLPKRIAEPKRRTTFTYHADGSVATKTQQATDDADGRLGFEAAVLTDPPARVWTYARHTAETLSGQVSTVTPPAGGVTAHDYWNNASFCYLGGDQQGCRGQLKSSTNALGHVTYFDSYNAHSQPLAIRQQITVNPPTFQTIVLTYDPRQRLKTRTVGNEVTSYDYNAVGQLIKVTQPDGVFLEYVHDDAQRLKEIKDKEGNRVAYKLDLAGNRTAECVFPAGSTDACDPQTTTQAIQKRSRTYSNLNRLERETAGSNPAEYIDYLYKLGGQLETITTAPVGNPPVQHVTQHVYDDLNRLEKTTDPAGGVTFYKYDGLDSLTKVTDPNNLHTEYMVDGLGNLREEKSPSFAAGKASKCPAAELCYDAAGNRLKWLDARNQKASYTYDALNRVASATFQDASAQVSYTQTYGYDAGVNGAGRLTSITESSTGGQASVQYAYDPQGRTISETRTIAGVPYVTSYSYDSAGRLIGVVYPSGRTVSYQFDSLGRVYSITTAKDGQSRLVAYEIQYHPFGGPKSWKYANGQTYTRGIDLDGRISSYTLGGPSTAIGFDAAGRISDIGANLYIHDKLDRLTSAVLPSSSSNYGYSYDANGNRASKIIGANSEQYITKANSSWLECTAAQGSQNCNSPIRLFSYDDNGSTISDGLNRFAYDVRGRMDCASSAAESDCRTAAAKTTYQVNALGQRVRKTNSAGDTVFHYDPGGRLIAETSPAGAVIREYVYLGDIPVGVLQ